MAKTAKKKTTYHHGNLRSALIKAGMKLAVKKGADNLSLRDVAKAAGVSHTAPYRHFENKEALLAAIGEEGFDKLAGYLRKAIEMHPDDPKEQFLESGWQYVKFSIENPERFKLIFRAMPSPPEPVDYTDIDPECTNAYGVLLYIVDQCKRTGVMTDQETNNIALTAWSLVHGFSVLLVEQEVVPKEAAQQVSMMMNNLLYYGVKA